MAIDSRVQAIAYNELQDPKHEILLEESATLARRLADEFTDVTVVELAVEVSVGESDREACKLCH